MNLRNRMLVFILLPVIVLTSFLSYYAYHTAENLLRSELLRGNKFTAESYSRKINEVLVKQEAVASSLAAIIAGKQSSKQEIAILINEAKKSNSEISNILVAFDTNEYVDTDGWNPPADYDVRTRDWYKKIFASTGITYTDVYESASNHKLMADVGCPIVVNGKKIGVIAIDVQVEGILNVTSSMKNGDIGYVFVLDNKGSFISHPVYKAKDRLQTIENGSLAGFFEQIQKEKNVERIIPVEGKDRMCQAVSIGQTGWTLVTSTDYDALFGGIKEMAVILTIASIIVIILLGGLILYIVRYIVGALDKMIAACEALADGDFREKPRKVILKDEIGRVADAIILTRDKLRELMKKVSDSAEQVAAASEELTASASQSAQASNQVAISITNVAQGADEQTTALGKTKEVVMGMGDQLQSLGKTAQRVAETATSTTQKASHGAQAVNEAIGQMNSINRKMEESSKVVATLGDRSQEVGQIVDTISGIAGQTNLLALNAAIEAARAGEQGRGFAVVAEEVRKLAEQSQEAAKHIADLISHIQADTEDAVQAMQEGNQEVQLGSSVVNKTGEIFAEIETMIQEVNTQVGLAHAAMIDIDAASANITHSIESVDEISKNTSSEAQNVSAATEEQAASMEEMSTASMSLANLAQDLQNAVNKFKI